MKFIAKAMAFIMILAAAVLTSIGAVSATQTVYLSNITDDTELAQADTIYILDGQTYNIADKGTFSVIRIMQNNITLDCNGSTLIGDGTGVGIYIADVAKGVKIKGCTIKNYQRGIFTNDAADPQITGNTLQGNEYGIYLNGLIKNSNVQISKNIGKDNKKSFIYMYGRGLQDFATISENTASGGDKIININNVENLKVSKNTLKNGALYGITDMTSNGIAEISENKIDNSGFTAIFANSLQTITVKSNSGSGNGMFIDIGDLRTKAEIADNTASWGAHLCIGLSGSGAQGSTIHNNKCFRYGSGIEIQSNLIDTEIYSNVLDGYWSSGAGIEVDGEANNTKVYSNTVNDFATGILIQPFTGEPITTLVYDNTIKDGKDIGIHVNSITQAGTEVYRNKVGGFKNAAILLSSSKNLKVYNNTDYYSPILDKTFLNPEKTAAGVAVPVSKSTSKADLMASSQLFDTSGKEYVLGTAPVPKAYKAGAQPVKQPALPKTFIQETGIKLVNSESNKIESNTFSYFKYGLYLLSSKSNEVLTNTFNKNEYGMFLDSSDSNTIKGNEARLNTEAGLKLKGSKSNTVESNKLINNSKYGLVLEATSTGNTFTSNDLTGNKLGAAYMVDSTTKLTSDSDDATNTWTTNVWPSGAAMQTAMVPAKPKTSTTATKPAAITKQPVKQPTKQIARKI